MEDQGFQVIKDIVQPDGRGRISLGMVASGKNYRVMINEMGQILLDPVIAVPEREAWLWQNPEAISSVQRGIQESEEGELHDLGSFAQYTDVEVED